MSEIEITPSGVVSKIIVDGADVSDRVTSYRFDQSAGKLAELQLNVYAHGLRAAGDAEVGVLIGGELFKESEIREMLALPIASPDPAIGATAKRLLRALPLP